MELIHFKSLFLFLWLPFATAVNSTYTPCERSSGCITSASPAELRNISLRVYIDYSTDLYQSVLVANASQLLNVIDTSKSTVVYISGWRETADTLSTKTVLSAYADRQDHNIIYADYAHIAELNYLYVVASINGVGYYLASGLSQLVKAGLDPSSLHMVGHSIGGQIVGYIGRYSDFELVKIIALDPAGPLFEFDGDDLSSTDAKFVNAIHTDAGFYGSATVNGTVNFYANGGTRLQRGCPSVRFPFSADDFCDHQRSWYYYSEALLNETAFIGVKCDSYSDFQEGQCSLNDTVVMGYATPSNTTGNYYLQTNTGLPLGLGVDGLTYEE